MLEKMRYNILNMNPENNVMAASTGTVGRFVNPAEVVHLFELKEGSKFADFGAGTGAYTLAAAPLVGKTGSTIAIDIQKDILLKLKAAMLDAGHSNGKFLWCDFEKLGSTKLPDASLDVAVMSNTLFQLGDKTGALSEAHRVLKSDGKLYIIDWSESYSGMGPSEELIVTKDHAIKLAVASGFTLNKEFSPGEHHYGVELIKK